MAAMDSLRNNENPAGSYDVSGYTKVYFDLETTGTKIPEVCQIGAYFAENSFSRYVCPKGKFEAVVSGLTGLYKKDGFLYLRGERVETVSIIDAWKDFVKFLQSANNKVVLVIHDRHNDCNLLFRDLLDLSLLDEFRNVCAGVIDTVPLFRYVFPGRKEMGKNYTLKGLVQDKLGKESSSGSHNAVTDAVNLEKLIKLADVQPNIFQKNFFPLFRLEKKYRINREARLLMDTFPSMKKMRAIDIAKAGITFNDYNRCYMEGGEEGVASLLSDRVKPRKPKYKKRKPTANTPHLSKQGKI